MRAVGMMGWETDLHSKFLLRDGGEVIVQGGVLRGGSYRWSYENLKMILYILTARTELCELSVNLE